mmetsp:Transcript_17150/g.26509  ORF Transcript_17150/g.26509 Transcript_17150/m.26509 type:complete len:80 (+) Transcript_17150:172-411(+)
MANYYLREFSISPRAYQLVSNKITPLNKISATEVEVKAQRLDVAESIFKQLMSLNSHVVESISKYKKDHKKVRAAKQEN